MKLIVGLGNVGSQYARTRHNAGFMIIDRLAELLNATAWRVESKFKGEIAEAALPSGSAAIGADPTNTGSATDAERVILLKPHTFMNLSGESVAAAARFYKINPADIWIIHDELDIPFGRLRLRRGGSAGGHNGLKSIIAHLGEEFLRARFGISQNDRARMPSEHYVLAGFTSDEQISLPRYLAESAKIIHEQLTSPEADETTFDLN